MNASKDPTPAFLDVEASLSGRRWEARLPAGLSSAEAERLAVAISQQAGVSEIVGRILALRGQSPETAPAFLSPSLRRDLPDPSVFTDMDRAAARLADAVEAGEQVAVFGDYDVDGATSSALLHRYFRALGRDLAIYIPDRLAEGYGPNAPALLGLKEGGASVVLTVDCGITAFEPLEAAQAAGLDVIVVDHHVAEPRLPPAVAIVNPNRLDDTSGYGQLAAVGVSFMLVVALNRTLRERGYFSADRREPDLIGLLDLVALGTICDVVPLTSVNRALVAQGLRVMAKRQNAGLCALGDVAGIAEPPGVYHAGFLLGPRVNAGGRVGEAPLGARLLTTENSAEAAEIAGRLDRYNKERQAIEKETLEAAIEAIERDRLAEHPVVFAADQGWHPGVIGIVASRLVERFGRPACVVGVEAGIGKGSGRSVSGVDLGNAVIAARQAGLLVNGGGHKMAAGFTVEAAKIDALRAFLSERLGDAVAAATARPTQTVDAALSVEAATLNLLQELEQAGPFGIGNPGPRLVLADARIAFSRRVGTGHVQLRLAGDTGVQLKGIAFGVADTPLGEALLAGQGRLFHLAGSLRADNWQGRQGVQFMVDDAAPA